MAIDLGPDGLTLGSTTVNDWADVGGGKVLQVVNTSITTDYTTTSTSFQTGPSLSITPSSTSSKILVIASGSMGSTAGPQEAALFRNSTNIGAYQAFQPDANWNASSVTGSWSKLDSPSTTSSVTYSIKHRVTGSGGSWLGRSGDNSMGRSDLMITLMEIAP